MAIPALGAPWSHGFRLRVGRPADARFVAEWQSDDFQVSGALAKAVERLQARDGRCFVLVQTDLDAVVGILTLDRPHLNFAYRIDRLRSRGIATLAGAVLVDHYFATTNEPWLGDSGSVSSSGDALTRHLGFVNGRLTREAWTNNRASFAARFTPTT